MIMTPADAITVTLATGAALYAAYRLVKWLADRTISAIGHLTRWEK